ncbi:MAG TPA: class I SAM-dependent methyltransferase [Chloroflexota bacterium]|nr:class I SAM-dependent methyltransferase [Chloroflexota bacterium]
MGPRSGSGRAPSLHDQRIAAVVATLKAHGASSVLDLGCGEGRLLRELLADRSFERIVGLDVSYRSLEWARGRPAAEAHTPLTPRPPTPGMALTPRLPLPRKGGGEDF